MENPIEMDDLGLPLVLETPIWSKVMMMSGQVHHKKWSKKRWWITSHSSSSSSHYPVFLVVKIRYPIPNGWLVIYAYFWLAVTKTLAIRWGYKSAQFYRDYFRHEMIGSRHERIRHVTTGFWTLPTCRHHSQIEWALWSTKLHSKSQPLPPKKVV